MGLTRQQKLATLPAGGGGTLGKKLVTSHLEILTLTRRFWIGGGGGWGLVSTSQIFDGQQQRGLLSDWLIC